MVNTKIRLIIFFAAKDGEALNSQQKQDRDLTVAQIMTSLLHNSDLNKVGKATRPFRYDLNQILYRLYSGSDKYIQGIRSDRVPEELWMDVCNIVWEAVTKTIPKKKKFKKAKWLSEEAFQVTEERR